MSVETKKIIDAYLKSTSNASFEQQMDALRKIKLDEHGINIYSTYNRPLIEVIRGY